MQLLKALSVCLIAGGQALAAPTDTRDKPEDGLAQVSTPIEIRDKWPADGTYKKTILKHHNVHRKNHSAHDISWGHDLVKSATVLAKRCVFAHDVTIMGGGYGQNLALGIKRSHISEAITDLFYNQEMPKFKGKYGEANPSDFYDWGHFSQIVWKATKKVGCVTHDCSKGGVRDGNGNKLSYPPYLTVCNYSPPGNYAGEYGKNIGKPLGHPVIDAQY